MSTSPTNTRSAPKKRIGYLTPVPLDALKRSGESCARHHGHQLGPWHDTLTHGSTATCTRCHASVTANPNPPKNEIDLMGTALTTDCTRKRT